MDAGNEKLTLDLHIEPIDAEENRNYHLFANMTGSLNLKMTDGDTTMEHLYPFTDNVRKVSVSYEHQAGPRDGFHPEPTDLISPLEIVAVPYPRQMIITIDFI